MKTRKRQSVGAAAAAKPVKTITQLYAAFLKADAELKAFPSEEAYRASGGTDFDAAFSKPVDKAWAIGGKIVRAPAASLDEMLIKIRVAGYCSCDG